jgi:hypothetical protein
MKLILIAMVEHSQRTNGLFSIPRDNSPFLWLISNSLSPVCSCLALHHEGERINKQGSRGRQGKLISDGLTSPPHWAADGQGDGPSDVFSKSKNRLRVAAHMDKWRAG